MSRVGLEGVGGFEVLMSAQLLCKALLKGNLISLKHFRHKKMCPQLPQAQHVKLLQLFKKEV